MSKRGRSFSTTQIIAFGFFSAILIGSLVLSLPVCATSGEPTSYIDSLFTATTSVCVTGLVVVQTFSHWSVVGQIVILCLIQLGGLGIVSFTTAFLMLLGRRITLHDRLLLEDALNLNTLSGLVRFLRKVFKYTFCTELLGVLGYSFVFIPKYGAVKGLWSSLFLSVSAFCNAGMDVMGADSLAGFLTNPWINFVTISLIVLGGIGFIVWMDLRQFMQKVIRERFSLRRAALRFRLHTKIVLITTAVLIFTGAFLILILEYRNPDTLGRLSFPEKLLASLFQSVTTRTAGFFTVPQEALKPTTILVCLFLMFIGGSSISTAGGIKTTTVALLFLSARSTIKGMSEVEVFHKRIPPKTIKKALAVTIVSFFVLLCMIVLLYELEGGSLLDIVFEATSAIATVGLSRDLTGSLHLSGKLIIILMMYLGRIGPISMAIIIGKRQKKALIAYPTEDIAVG